MVPHPLMPRSGRRSSCVFPPPGGKVCARGSLHSRYADTLVGDAVTATTLLCGAGDDVLTGGAGNDVLRGGDGNDTLAPGLGDDGTGADPVTGGSGVDTLDYSNVAGPVDVNLSAGTETGAGSDTLSNDIENVVGTAGSDTITGDANGNVLTGGAGSDSINGGGGDDTLTGQAGNDTLEGGPGDDALDGGMGSNTVTYASESGAGVKVNLRLGTSSPRPGGEAGFDTLQRLENVIGSHQDDVIQGDAADNNLVGNGGSDTVSFAGAGGPVVADLTSGTATGDGDDNLSQISNLIGSSFGDSLTGDAADNTLNGGAGDDFITGRLGTDVVTGDLGNDVIYVRDGVADMTSCGLGTDLVQADAIDSIATDCETVSLPPPDVTTGSATNVTKKSVTFNGTVNPNGEATSYYFQWGVTTAYGSKSPDGQLSVGTSPVAVSFNAGGLKLRTTYHFRLVATSSSGTTYGTDMTFTTPAK